MDPIVHISSPYDDDVIQALQSNRFTRNAFLGFWFVAGFLFPLIVASLRILKKCCRRYLYGQSIDRVVVFAFKMFFHRMAADCGLFSKELPVLIYGVQMLYIIPYTRTNAKSCTSSMKLTEIFG